MPVTLNKRVKKKKKVEKRCRFPTSDTEVCGAIFYGIGPSKYCEEHRKLKYRKFINRRLAAAKRAAEVPMEDANQVIKHKHNEAVTAQFECALCGKSYSVTILPRTYIYPKFCEEHRSAYKRERYRQMHSQS